MRITIIAYGTRGDVQPAIALGTALHTRGHQVRVLAGASFHDWIRAHGLEPGQTGVDIQKIMESEGGVAWVEEGHNPLRQIQLMKRLLDQSGWPQAWDAWQAAQDADLLISGFTSDVYATAIAEKLGIPHARMLLQPTFTTRDGRALLSAPWPDRRSIVNQWFAQAIMEPFPWRLLGEITTRLRRELGLAPQSAGDNAAMRRALPTLLAYSPAVVPHPDDWPANAHTTGYWFLNEVDDWRPPESLQRFLEAGPPPIYIGFGSMTGRNPERLTRLIRDAVAQSGERALVAAGWSGLGAGLVADGLLPIGSTSHPWLFARVAGVVHHGGAGTTAAGLRAGRPTLIVPHFADQPFWGQRVHALGVGPRPIPRQQLTAARLAVGLCELRAPALRERAAALGGRISLEDGLSQAVTVIEGLDPTRTNRT